MKVLSKILMMSIVGVASCMSVSAQVQKDVYRRYTGAVVKQGATEKTLAWCGGVNTPQFGMADLNKDGKDDLVIFEKSVSKVRTFIQKSPGVYTYDPFYESGFPEMVTHYMKLVDFNRDNVPDLVHYNFYGANICFGYYSNAQLMFKPEKELWHKTASGVPARLYIAPGDIPVMEDLDKDGDIDIVSYHVGGYTMYHYDNCSIEDGVTGDSVSMCVKDQCWGKVYQGFDPDKLLLGYVCGSEQVSCKGCTTPAAKPTDGPNSICALDMDGDGDWDLLNATHASRNMIYMRNGRNIYGRDTIIAQDAAWEANGVRMSVSDFPAAFHIDIDQSGKKDLLFAPTTNNTENYNSILFYKNIGTGSTNNFVYQTNHYMVDKMIDLGSSSYPIFYDYDKDGKKDLFVGSEGYYDTVTGNNFSRISYFRNTGTGIGKFSFELVTEDFLGLGVKRWRGAALSIGDLDNDNLDDLVIGRTDGTLAFFKNYSGSPANQPDWKLTVDTIRNFSDNAVLDVGSNAAPCLYDISNDSRADLIVGTRNGNLVYIKNTGVIPGRLQLERKTNNLGGISKSTDANLMPYIGTTDNDGKHYLVLGSINGRLERYSGVRNGENATYTLIDSAYSYINIGRDSRTAPAFANLDNDTMGLHELVIGNVAGGLFFYRQDYKAGIEEAARHSADIRVYPNPATNTLNVNWDVSFNNGLVNVKLVSVTGATIVSHKYGISASNATIDIQTLAQGLYYCIVESGGERAVKPVTILR